MQFCECVLHQIIDFFGFSLLHLAFLPIFSMIAASKQSRLILKVLAMRGGFHSLSLPKLMRHLVTKLHSELLHTKVSSQTTQLSSHDSVLEATVVKNVEKIFAYFSKTFPDFKTGAKILWINFSPFLTCVFSYCDPNLNSASTAYMAMVDFFVLLRFYQRFWRKELFSLGERRGAAAQSFFWAAWDRSFELAN